MFGSHLMKSWSKDQNDAPARSSGEAELYAANKGTSEGMGLVSLAEDWGVSLDLSLELDASATKGILERQGLGRVRLMDVQVLWTQSGFRHDRAQLRKISDLSNTTDTGTKPLPWER